MEWNIFLITMGMLMSFGLIGIGVCIGDVYRNNKESSDGSDISGVLSDVRLRDGRSCDGSPVSVDRQEIEIVLYNLRIGASEREKAVIDYLLDKEGAENGEK